METCTASALSEFSASITDLVFLAISLSLFTLVVCRTLSILSDRTGIMSNVKEKSVRGAQDEASSVEELGVTESNKQVFGRINTPKETKHQSPHEGEDQTALREEMIEAWSDFYGNMTEEVEHNLDCWSPR
ncbi:hypothetical protein M758_UG337500 [Ceratodon purpureus]|nr:hypothetical protein M758_UG337500 [Ceratodon purpureus]